MVAAFPFHVAVTFVGGNEDEGAHGRCVAYGLQQIDAARNVAMERLERFRIAPPYQRLGGKVDDDLRLGLTQQFGDGIKIPDVDEMLVDTFGQTELLEQRRIRCRRQGEARDVSTEVGQPGGKPAALEPGRAGDQDSAVLENGEISHRIRRRSARVLFRIHTGR